MAGDRLFLVADRSGGESLQQRPMFPPYGLLVEPEVGPNPYKTVWNAQGPVLD